MRYFAVYFDLTIAHNATSQRLHKVSFNLTLFT